ncbi:MAG: type II toxin-antitoxin system PemK/MazF family toxin [Myxococcaceae bacterium]
MKVIQITIDERLLKDLDRDAEGLKHRSAITLDNVQTVAKSDLKRFVGSLSREKVNAVCAALEFAVGCRD